MKTRITRREFLKRAAWAAAALAFQPRRTVRAAVSAPVPSLKFCGAAGFVSGSSHLLDTGRWKILLDCGAFLEPETAKYNGQFSFDPKEIDLVILSHAHGDHAGNLHQLLRKGFRGPIVCTDATRDIYEAAVDSLVDRDPGRSDPDAIRQSDLNAVLDSFHPVPYNTKAVLGDDLVLRYTDAGHMLGSAFIELWFGETKVVFTGDMGPHDAPVLCQPTILRRADYVIMESTYGGVTRPKEDWTRLGTIITETMRDGGSVLIPVFAAEKLQRVIYRIRQLREAGAVPSNLKVISDSTSGNRITDIYRRYTDYYDATAKSLNRPFNFPGFYEMTGPQALATHGGQSGIVYISTSGMMDHANSPRHLAAMCENPRNTLVFVGYQAPHTLGGKIYAGERNVTIKLPRADGSVEVLPKRIRMRVEKLRGYSGHADGAQLLQWMGNFAQLKGVFVVHGEKSRAELQAHQITAHHGFPALAPRLYQTVMLDRKDYVKRISEQTPAPAFGVEEKYDRQDY